MGNHQEVKRSEQIGVASPYFEKHFSLFSISKLCGSEIENGTLGKGGEGKAEFVRQK